MNRCINEILFNDNCAVIECKSKTFGIFNVLIDIEDIEKIQKYYWNVKPDGNNKHKFYVQSTEKGKRIHLHRYILGLGDFTLSNCVDHINGDPLDNRKENLRVCTHKENMQNKKLSKRNKAGVKYIVWCNTHKRWKVIYKNKYKGSFINLEDAKKRLEEIKNCEAA